MYSSDVGKMIGCPVLHVNGDNPEVPYASCCKGFYLNLKGEGVPIGKYQPLRSPRGWGEHSAMLCMKTTGYQYRYSFMTIPLKCLRAEYFPLDADLTQSISLPSPYS